MAKIIQERCAGCGLCANICPDGIELVGGKARIKNENADCLKDAANACPRNAILLDENSEEPNNRPIGFGQGRGMGRGMGKGSGRGMGKGRGMGRGRRWSN